jgi:hypothetical protein
MVTPEVLSAWGKSEYEPPKETAYFTVERLMDLARLTWTNLDLVELWAAL